MQAGSPPLPNKIKVSLGTGSSLWTFASGSEHLSTVTFPSLGFLMESFNLSYLFFVKGCILKVPGACMCERLHKSWKAIHRL